MKVLTWLKNNFLWVLGGIAALFAVIFAIKYERDKVGVYKAKRLMSKHLGAAEGLRDAVSNYDEEDTELVEAERKIDTVIVDLESEMKEVERDVKDRDAQEVADRFNELDTLSGWTKPE